MAVSHDRPIARELTTRCQAALQILLEAYTNAQNLRAGFWTGAVALEQLRQAGLAEHDLRWLVLRGYVEPDTQPTACDGRRALCWEGMQPLTQKTCVVLTDSGAAWLRALGKDVYRRQAVQPETPAYDRRARELRVGALVVKRFRQPATSQEWILLAFQEQ